MEQHQIGSSTAFDRASRNSRCCVYARCMCRVAGRFLSSIMVSSGTFFPLFILCLTPCMLPCLSLDHHAKEVPKLDIPKVTVRSTLRIDSIAKDPSTADTRLWTHLHHLPFKQVPVELLWPHRCAEAMYDVVPASTSNEYPSQRLPAPSRPPHYHTSSLGQHLGFVLYVYLLCLCSLLSHSVICVCQQVDSVGSACSSSQPEYLSARGREVNMAIKLLIQKHLNTVWMGAFTAFSCCEVMKGA
jgi:hypothetical protein